MLLYYFALKTLFLLALVKSLTQFEQLQKRGTFLAGLYTAALAFLSWVFILAPNKENPGWRSLEIELGRMVGLFSVKDPWPVQVQRAWLLWLGESFSLTSIYFGLMARFDEGALFWIILLGGMGFLLIF